MAVLHVLCESQKNQRIFSSTTLTGWGFDGVWVWEINWRLRNCWLNVRLQMDLALPAFASYGFSILAAILNCRLLLLMVIKFSVWMISTLLCPIASTPAAGYPEVIMVFLSSSRMVVCLHIGHDFILTYWPFMINTWNTRGIDIRLSFPQRDWVWSRFPPVAPLHLGVEVCAVLWSACSVTPSSDLLNVIDVFFGKRKPFTCTCDICVATVQERLSVNCII
jgi:hypothetical protein